MVSVSKVILLRATTCRALFRVLSPPRLSLCRTVFPEEAGMGLTPAREAKAASEWTRPWWDQTVRQMAAVTGPKPVSCSRGAASLISTSSVIRELLVLMSASSPVMCLASRTASERATDRASGSSRARQRDDFGDLGSGQGFARVQAEVVDPEQGGQRVHGPGAFGGHGLPCGDQDPQGRADSFVQPWLAQLLLIQGQDGCGDPVRVERIGFADPVPGPGIHAGGFGDLVAGGADGTGQQGAVGGGALDHPQGRQVSAGVARDPGDGPVDPGPGGGEVPGGDQLTGAGGDDGVDMVFGVRVDADDKRAGMRNDSHGGSGTFLYSRIWSGPYNGRYQSG